MGQTPIGYWMEAKYHLCNKDWISDSRGNKIVKIVKTAATQVSYFYDLQMTRRLFWCLAAPHNETITPRIWIINSCHNRINNPAGNIQIEVANQQCKWAGHELTRQHIDGWSRAGNCFPGPRRLITMTRLKSFSFLRLFPRLLLLPRLGCARVIQFRSQREDQSSQWAAR